MSTDKPTEWPASDVELLDAAQLVSTQIDDDGGPAACNVGEARTRITPLIEEFRDVLDLGTARRRQAADQRARQLQEAIDTRLAAGRALVGRQPVLSLVVAAAVGAVLTKGLLLLRPRARDY